MAAQLRLEKLAVSIEGLCPGYHSMTGQRVARCAEFFMKADQNGVADGRANGRPSPMTESRKTETKKVE